MNIQAPPNLSKGALARLIAAGINDWGGVSPVTPDHVNPERPWPALDALAEETAKAGKVLVERLALYPPYALEPERWLAQDLRSPVLRACDAEGLARSDPWKPGAAIALPVVKLLAAGGTALGPLLDRAAKGQELSEAELAALFGARGEDFDAVCYAADALRAETCGARVSYVVTRNINYTNICYFRCKFCAFSKGKLSENLRGRPYDLSHDEIVRRVREAWERGAVEVCLQGGIHPDYTGATYLAICRAIKAAVPEVHVHAFSPLEIWQGAATLGLSVKDFLAALKEAGLGSLPGTAAEMLDDEVRAVICPDKITTAQWLEVIETAHHLGLRTTATIMFGHVDAPRHWARHLLHLRRLQASTGGFTEFVPLPFVPMETPLHLRGLCRLGPTFREAVLMHAVARLALHPVLPNIQTSWVKLGADGAAACLKAGANDLGGTLMNESITRAAGAAHGQEMPPEAMEETHPRGRAHALAAHHALPRSTGDAARCFFRRGTFIRADRDAGAALRESRLFFVLNRLVERAVPALFRDIEQDAFGVLPFALVIHAARIAEIEGIGGTRRFKRRFGRFEIGDAEAEMMDAVLAIRGLRAGPVRGAVAEQREIDEAIAEIDRPVLHLVRTLHLEDLFIKPRRGFEILHHDRQMPQLRHGSHSLVSARLSRDGRAIAPFAPRRSQSRLEPMRSRMA